MIQLVTSQLLLFYFSLSNGNILVEPATKRAVLKTFQNEYGEILDCIDITKQPAFSYPSLKNHQIQMTPSSIPASANKESPLSYSPLSYSSIKDEGSKISCDPGSVPILRKSKKYIGNILDAGNNRVDTAKYVKVDTNYGARAFIIVYEPEVKEGKSGAWLEIFTSTSKITAGWMVDPKEYGDNHAHFDISWKNGDKGCKNLLCPGFVQIAQDITPGVRLNPVSTYNGTQYEIRLVVFKDRDSSNWWLFKSKDGDMKPVGYWPKELFTGMTDQADYAGFGGAVEGPINRPSPIGSGHFPSEGDGKAAYFQYIELVDKHNQFIIPDPQLFDLVCSKPRCYQVSELTETLQGLQLFFGGPGDCKG